MNTNNNIKNSFTCYCSADIIIIIALHKKNVCARSYTFTNQIEWALYFSNISHSRVSVFTLYWQKKLII